MLMARVPLILEADRLTGRPESAINKAPAVLETRNVRLVLKQDKTSGSKVNNAIAVEVY